jgi:hypothetical protein
MAILNAAGLTATRSEDHNDMAPLQVRVSAYPTPSPAPQPIKRVQKE